MKNIKFVFLGFISFFVFLFICGTNITYASYYSKSTTTTLAGTAGSTDGVVDGTGSGAHFNSPKGVSVDPSGNIYTVDNFSGTLRKITPTGVVTILAGHDGTFGSADGTGTNAYFNSPSGTATDSSGNVYVADPGNCTIRKVTSGGVVTTISGVVGDCSSIDGDRTSARLNGPTGLVVDSQNNIYMTSYPDCTIHKITQDGVVTTLAGVSTLCASVDGTGSSARFNNPSGIAIDNNGNLFTVDETGCTVRKITPTGIVTTLAGSPDHCGDADGTGSSAQFHVPSWVAIDSSGDVILTDYLNYTIRKVTQSGVVTTLAGLSGVSGSADGDQTSSRFNHPDGIAVDSSGNIYVSDRWNNTIRKIIDNSFYISEGSGGLLATLPPVPLPSSVVPTITPTTPIINPTTVPITPPLTTTPQLPIISTVTNTPQIPLVATTPITYNFGVTTLVTGSSGSGVKELQRFLNDQLNLGLKVDGIVGPKTITVIKKWQKIHGLAVDGIVGVKTRAALNSATQ